MKKLLPIFVFALVGFLSFSSFVQAQTAVSPISVIPARQELTVNPGGKEAINIKFLNRGEEPVSGPVKVADFIVEDKVGTPIFIEETPTVTGMTQISPQYSAASWVTLPYERISIAPKGEVNIQAKLNVPADAKPGGRYFAVYFEPAGTAGTGLGLGTEATSPVTVRIAGLVYLRVAGPVTEDARLVQFTAPKFLEYGPVTVTTEILNRGNYHIRPRGAITLTNMLGGLAGQGQLKEINIFPDASRVYTNTVGQKWMLGKHKVGLTVAYGETGKALTATVFVWVFPWKVALTMLLALIILILIPLSVFRQFKKREEELEGKLAAEEKEVKELKEKIKEKTE